VSDVVERLTSLRQHQEAGRRSPHKPLLVLLVLGHLVNTGTSQMSWDEVDGRLGFLLQEFGPPRKGGPKPEYPFTRLRSDMVWELSRDVPDDRVGPLNEEPITGRFVPEVESRLTKDPSAPYRVARGIVEQQFPMTIAPDVLIATGLDLSWSSVKGWGLRYRHRSGGAVVPGRGRSCRHGIARAHSVVSTDTWVVPAWQSKRPTCGGSSSGDRTSSITDWRCARCTTNSSIVASWGYVTQRR